MPGQAQAKEAESERRMQQANTRLDERNKTIAESLDHITNPKKQGKTFGDKLELYNRPKANVWAGTFAAACAGLVAPLFGFLIMKNLSEIMQAQHAQEDVILAAAPWIAFMVGMAVAIMLAKALATILFAKVGQNIIAGVRAELYESVLRKEIGWHDDRANSAGVITATLQSDVQLMNGASSEGKAAILEATFAFLWGLLLAFIFSWPMALVGVVAGPIMGIASYVGQKADNDMYFQGAVDKEVGEG